VRVRTVINTVMQHKTGYTVFADVARQETGFNKTVQCTVKRNPIGSGGQRIGNLGMAQCPRLFGQAGQDDDTHRRAAQPDPAQALHQRVIFTAAQTDFRRSLLNDF
jgi:hypothetical protein